MAMQEFTLSAAHALVFEIMGKRAFYYPLVDVARAYGYSPKTAYNQAIKNIFPIKTSKLGGKRVVALEDLVAAILSGVPITNSYMPSSSPPMALEPAKRRGRPTKVEQKRKQAQESQSLAR
jgi:hypothetical protein